MRLNRIRFQLHLQHLLKRPIIKITQIMFIVAILRCFQYLLQRLRTQFSISLIHLPEYVFHNSQLVLLEVRMAHRIEAGAYLVEESDLYIRDCQPVFSKYDLPQLLLRRGEGGLQQ